MATAPKRTISLLLALLGACFIGVATVTYYLESHVFSQVSVLETASQLLPGQPISRSDLVIASVPSSVGIKGLTPAAVNALVSKYSASVPVPPGTILIQNDLARRLPRGERILFLTPTVIPPNVQAGSVVDLLTTTTQTSTSTTPTTLLPSALPLATGVTILQVLPPPSGSNGIGVEVALSPKEVGVVAAAALHGQILVAFSSPGATPVPVLSVTSSSSLG